ncbi:putative dehydrogenase [Chryseomicrobium aureum]|uniref:Gfo/Idh/MocA family protein n=1 Tax=Chryseomicrobium aureum TaxID=1441723 RepID=UPI00195CDF8F|nr:Gfo/Idh/MocA family oxidoreductase [Chryseomicrobium aureum]MBM7706322.1 putative dehydrogenase [Chryseomicrobium aureum]
MTKQLKIGVIGTGMMAERMMNSFMNHPRLQINGICDVNKERVQFLAEKFQTTAYTSHQELLDTEELDIVYVAVPPKWHHEIATAVLQKGLHILCEKPLANSVEEAADLLKLAQQKGVVNAMNFPLNYEEGTRQFEKLMHENYVGKLRRVELRMEFPNWPRPRQQNSWISTREQGGFVFEVAGHLVQQILRTFGPITEVTSDLELPEDPTLSETGIVATMQLASGTKIYFNGIAGTAGAYSQDIELSAYGTEGTVKLSNYSNLTVGKIGEDMTSYPLEDNVRADELLDAFVAAVDGQPAELYDFQVGYDVQVVLEKLRKVKN